MDSPNNPFSCINAASSINNPPRISLPPPASPFVAEPVTYSATKDISYELSSAVQVTNTAYVPALASPFVTPNNSVGSIYEKLPTAWATLSEAERAEVAGWIEVVDDKNTEHLLKHGEIFNAGQVISSTSEIQNNKQANYFSIFMENNEIRFKSLMNGEIMVNGAKIESEATCVLNNNSFIQLYNHNVFYIVYKFEKLELRIGDPSLDFGLAINNKYAVTSQLLGHGTYGDVFYGETRDNKTPIAVKICDKKKIKGATEDDSVNELEEENAMVAAAQGHPNIIKLVNTHQTEGYNYLIFEYAAGGDLLSYCKCHGRLAEQEAKHIFKQLLEGVKHLHAKDIVHLDIKPANILLRKHVKYPSIIITDFGTARKLNSKKPVFDNIRGSNGYMAPDVILRSNFRGEIIKNVVQNNSSFKDILYGPQFLEKGYKKEADLWSLDATLYYMLSNKLPYKADDSSTTEDYIIDILSSPLNFGDGWDGVSEKARNLICGLLAVDRTSRLTAKQALKNEWFTESPENPSDSELIQATLEEEEIVVVEAEAGKQEVVIEEKEPTEKEEEIITNNAEEEVYKNSTASNAEDVVQKHAAVPTNQHGIKRARSTSISSDQRPVKVSKKCNIL
ncbi:kinase-like domain-containing protein [Syncephalis fuscata]|nr:kinase-like domain-containing protein [Syncephalis fuscata]